MSGGRPVLILFRFQLLLVFVVEVVEPEEDGHIFQAVPDLSLCLLQVNRPVPSTIRPLDNLERLLAALAHIEVKVFTQLGFQPKKKIGFEYC